MFYQLKANIKNQTPVFWRRIIVPSDITFAQLAALLEIMLESTHTNKYMFQFFSRKERLVEWRDGSQPSKDEKYTYIHAPDTFINNYFAMEKSFTFNIGDGMVEYKIDIERPFDGFTIVADGKKLVGKWPQIVKEITFKGNFIWTDSSIINQKLRAQCEIHYADPEYAPVLDVIAQIQRGNGILCSTDVKSRTNKIVTSYNSDIEKVLKSRVDGSVSASPVPTESYPKREFSMVDLLKSYTKENLISISEAYGIELTGKTKSSIATDIARYLLTSKTMKEKLLELSEEELDAFEHLIENGPYIPTKEQKKLLSAVYDIDYLASFSDKSYQVPDEAILIYNSIKKNGYRDYHRKALWLKTCTDVFETIYAVAPLQVMYRMFLQDKSIKCNLEEFKDLVNSVKTTCMIADDLFVIRDIYLDGRYKNVLADKRTDIDYYKPNKEEILSLANDGYINNNPQYQDIKSFLMDHLPIEEKQSTGVCQILYAFLSNGSSPSKAIKLLENIGVKLSNRRLSDILLNKVKEAQKNTRLLSLNGFTPNEVPAQASEKNSVPFPLKQNAPVSVGHQPYRAEKKIGPNDPCPCGSGKKYKKCCRNK